MKRIKLLCIALILFNVVSGQKKEASIIISKEQELYHKPIDIKAIDLPPNKRLVVELNAIDAKSNAWKSEAIYLSDARGSIDLTQQASIGGDYLGIHPMGLFWSMTCNTYHQISTNSGFNATISIKADSTVIVSKTIYRTSTRELEQLNIQAFPKRDSVIANFYLPKADKRVPAIIFLGGSGGGFRQERASLYASEGYAVLDLKYFRFESLPDGIIEIPLEYVEKAYNWLVNQPEIDRNKIGIIGRSRGSELAMLYASKFEGLRFVIAQAPSNVVWFGWEEGKSSWTFKNEPFAYAEYTDEDSERIEQELKEKKLQYRDGLKFLSAFKEEAVINRSTIEVENIKCPILFISGKDDQVWPATMMANRMVERLQEKKFAYEFLHLAYENAGHNFAGGGQGCGIPFLPPEDYSKKAAKGGTDEGNALAAIASWKDILKFIQRHMKD